MPNISEHELIGMMKQTAEEAGNIALEGFRVKDLEYSLKQDIHDIVTVYDKRCEEYIIAKILDRYPGSSIVGEETGTAHGEGPLTWYIDPIDGTANFARGVSIWAVSIGVALDGEMVGAVINDASNGQMFWADETGAYLNERPIESWGHPDQSSASLVANFGLPRDFRFAPELVLEQYKELQLTFGHIKQLDCATVPLCWVAAGWLDGSFGFETNSWDVAAASFILRQSGASYWTYINGERRQGFFDLDDIHYFAAVPDARYPLVDEIMRSQSSRPSRNVISNAV